MLILRLTAAGLADADALNCESEAFFDVRLEPGKNVVHVATYDWFVRSYLVHAAADVRTTVPPDTHTRTTRFVAASADGTRVVTVGYDNHVKVWRTADLSPVADLDLSAVEQATMSLVRSANAVFVGDSNARVVIAAFDRHAWEWDLDATPGSAEAVRMLPFEPPVNRVAASADGRRIFASGGGNAGGTDDAAPAKVMEYDRGTARVRTLASYPGEAQRNVIVYAFARPSATSSELTWVTYREPTTIGTAGNTVESIDLDAPDAHAVVRVPSLSEGLRDCDV